MSYKAGQYLKIAYPHGEFMPFSIANSPTGSNEIELHIRVAPDDLDTEQFIELAATTKQVLITGPFGDCAYPKENSRPLIILAAGTGFAPAKAIIEKIIEMKDVTRECHLYWSVKQSVDFYLPDMPKIWQNALINFHYVPIITRSEKLPKTTMLEAVLRDIGNFSLYDVYVFGPHALALNTLQLLSERGLKKETLFTDVL
ncbi:MAG: hypothetical protein H0U71_09345 [Gammaproteobacteria bacterium]|nr:hypothetical protein [Gammaproteobacteria bacterium]